MLIHFQNEKHLEVSSARLTESGDIEVLFDSCSEYDSAWIIEYELDWYIVFRKPDTTDDDTCVDAYESYLIENQLDIYRLNASL